MSYSAGNLLMLVRSAKNLSQEKLAKKIGMSKSAVSLYESEKRNLSPNKFQVICEKIGLSTNLSKLILAKDVSPNDKKLAQELGLLLLREITKELE